MSNILVAFDTSKEYLRVYEEYLMFIGQKVNIFDHKLEHIEHTGIFRGINSYGHAIIEENSKEITISNGRMR